MLFKKVPCSSLVAPVGTGRCCENSPEPFFSRLNNLSQLVSTAEVLHPSDHLCGLTWICSNTSMPFLCWRAQSRSRWDFTGAEQRGRMISFDLLGPALFLQPRMQMVFRAVSTHCQSPGASEGRAGKYLPANVFEASSIRKSSAETKERNSYTFCLCLWKKEGVLV